MGNVDVLQFHTFGTPFLKSCSCCGSKESSRGQKSHFWARIDLEHAFMLINVSPNWLFRWRKMQNRWSTVQTHSVLMIFEAKIGIFWITGSEVDLASELQSSSYFCALCGPSQLFTTCAKKMPWSERSGTPSDAPCPPLNYYYPLNDTTCDPFTTTP